MKDNDGNRYDGQAKFIDCEIRVTVYSLSV